METFWFWFCFFRLRFRRAYDFAFRFLLGRKRSYDSDFHTVGSENQPVEIFLFK